MNFLLLSIICEAKRSFYEALHSSLTLQDIIATLGVRLGPALKLIAAAMIKSKGPQPRSKN